MLPRAGVRGLSFAATLCAGIAHADGLPAIHAIVGVSEGDVLNVRAAPNASSDLRGSFEPNAQSIEVVKVSANGWGLVNSGEGSGWVNMRFLELRTPFQWPPAALACFGTEPFWDVQIKDAGDGHEMTLSTLDGESVSGAANLNSSANILGRYSAFASLPSGNDIAALLRREQCSDGMSDRAYGLSVEVIARSGAVHLSGCCSVSVP